MVDVVLGCISLTLTSQQVRFLPVLLLRPPLQASLVTYPGMGSLSELMSHTERLQRAAEIRKPLGDEIQKVFGVDLQAWGAGARGDGGERGRWGE